MNKPGCETHRKMLQPTALHPKPTFNRLLENPPGLRGRRTHTQQPSRHLLQNTALLFRNALIASLHNKTRKDRLHLPQPRQITLIPVTDVEQLFEQLEYPIPHRRRIAEREVPEDEDDFWMVYRSQGRLKICQSNFEIIPLCAAVAGEEVEGKVDGKQEPRGFICCGTRLWRRFRGTKRHTLKKSELSGWPVTALRRR